MRHNILFIEKPNNLINYKISLFPLKITTYIILEQFLIIYLIKYLFDFSKSRIVISCINCILPLNL